ncbi:MAG: adenylyl-sulfate kinase [Alphaproteobacteria bacterium]
MHKRIKRKPAVSRDKAKGATAPAVEGGRAPLNVAVVGHVDHGKSTLVGHLLHQIGALPKGRQEAVEAMCRKRGLPFEWAFVTDAFQAERDQGITIDVSHIRFTTDGRDYVLLDAPGHREFLKNMISGAAQGDAALLVIDAKEGVREQSRRHGYLVHLLGIRQVVVAINKMDLVDYGQARFAEIEQEYRAYLKSIGVRPAFVIPVSAREGENLARHSARMDWYEGPCVLEALVDMRTTVRLSDLALRMPVQDVYRFDDRRIIAGRIESGQLRVGERLLFSPSNKTAVIKSIEAWNVGEPVIAARAGQSIGFTLEEQIFIERGELVSHEENPPLETNVFRARIFWLAKSALIAGARYTIKLGTLQTPVTVERIERVIDTGDLTTSETEALERDAVGEVILRARAMLALDPHEVNPRTGRFILLDGYDVVAGGIIDMQGYPDQRPLMSVKSTNIQAVEHAVDAGMRGARNGHQGAVLWFTGLSGAGKSTIAIELERRLFAKGYQVYVLDGDNIRRGLNANLGFSPDDRAENIRRVGEVAALFAEAGMIVISAFISPYRSDRERARAATGDGFREIFVHADLKECERRDPKGLYAKARAGEIAEFTGISAPYEAPENADLVIDTGSLSVEDSVRALVDYVAREFELTAR